MGYCLIGVLATKIGVDDNDLCRSCGDEVAQESTFCANALAFGSDA